MRTEREEAARAPPTEMTREPLRASRRHGRRRDDPRPRHRRADRCRPDTRGLTHGLAAVDAELRVGVVFAAAVGADGHRRRCSTGRNSTACQSIGQIDASKGSMLACAPVRWLSGALLLCAAGCASARPRGVPVRATPALARESLHVSVVYPGPTDVIQARDSTFLFGAVRGAVGRESLTA